MRQVSTSIAIQLRNMFAHFSRNEVASTGANAFKKYCFQRIVWGKWNEVSQRKSWRGSAKENFDFNSLRSIFFVWEIRRQMTIKEKKGGGGKIEIEISRDSIHRSSSSTRSLSKDCLYSGFTFSTLILEHDPSIIKLAKPRQTVLKKLNLSTVWAIQLAIRSRERETQTWISSPEA